MDPVKPVEQLEQLDVRRGEAATPEVEISTARHALDEARRKLDAALARMPDVDGDEAMATPELLMVLVGAVSAKNRLDAIEALCDPSGERK